jgi:isoleucyl-tRNA synthetase
VAKDDPESVHLADFPVADKSKIDRRLSDDISLAMRIASVGRAVRSKAGIKVRQPLPKVIVSVASNKERESLERTKPQILEELNVKDLEARSVKEILSLDPNSFEVGPERTLPEEGMKALKSGGVYFVALPKDIPDELLAEGVAREIVRRLQTMRRSAGFDIADHIVTCYRGDDYIKKVMSDFADYIKQETLSRELVEGAPGTGAFSESHKLSGHEITLGVKRL